MQTTPSDLRLSFLSSSGLLGSSDTGAQNGKYTMNIGIRTQALLSECASFQESLPYFNMTLLSTSFCQLLNPVYDFVKFQSNDYCKILHPLCACSHCLFQKSYFEP